MPRRSTSPSTRRSKAQDRRADFVFSILNRGVAIRCAEDAIREQILAGYGAMKVRPATGGGGQDLEYEITPVAGTGGFRLRPGERRARHAPDVSALMFLLEKDLTVRLQKLRRDLYFLHAAALEKGGRATLLVAESGGGKSTLAWALLHCGFRYLSDELAPIAPARLEVHAYRRALWLKTDPPAPYPLPARAVRTPRGVQIPVSEMPAGAAKGPMSIGAIFFLTRDRGSRRAARRLGAAEASARLYVHALNPLAHPADGLDAAVDIASRVPCFELRVADVRGMSRAVQSAVARIRA